MVCVSSRSFPNDSPQPVSLSDPGEKVCHCHRLCNPVASLGFPSLAEADVHAGIGGRFVNIVVVCQEILRERAFVAEVFLKREEETQEEMRDASVLKTFIWSDGLFMTSVCSSLTPTCSVSPQTGTVKMCPVSMTFLRQHNSTKAVQANATWRLSLHQRIWMQRLPFCV